MADVRAVNRGVVRGACCRRACMQQHDNAPAPPPSPCAIAPPPSLHSPSRPLPPFLFQTVDRFNNLFVTAFVTPGGARFLLLHDGKGDDACRSFFLEVYELYLRVRCPPPHVIISPAAPACTPGPPPGRRQMAVAAPLAAEASRPPSSVTL